MATKPVINLPEIGGDEDIWGSILNDNLENQDTFNEEVETELNKAIKSFDTEAQMKSALYLTIGDKVELWGDITLDDGTVEKRIISESLGLDGILLDNLLYANLLSYDFKTEIENKLPKGAVSVDYDTAKKIEDKVEYLYDQRTLHLLLTGGANGINTLSDDWDNYKEIVIVTSRDTTGTDNTTQHTIYTDITEASDSTVVGKIQLLTSETTVAWINLRDTNRNEVYFFDEGNDDSIIKIYGKGKII